MRNHRKYLPVAFFVGGFIWDTLTLGRIDRLYDQVILCLYLAMLSLCLYLYNLTDDGRWRGTLLERFEAYFPLAIQFFLGGLSSAFVIYFSRSVSLSKTVSFFVILLVLLFANELLKHRISNKYLQFSAYFFVNFTFFAFFLPVLLREMNHLVFILSGVVSLFTTLALIVYIYRVSPSTQAEIRKSKMLGLIIGIYGILNAFYYFNLIPPVPLAMEAGLIAHDVRLEEGNYVVTYEEEDWYAFWRDNKYEFDYKYGEPVYAFSSIFAPSELKKVVSHRWKRWNLREEDWEVLDDIDFEIIGGRDGGYRGFSYKTNLPEGEWRVDVITEEGFILGIIKFRISSDSSSQHTRLVSRVF